ncbi:MAG: protoporphyrinogen oxidase HemJ [Minwuia sp.]|nr:protoporphyrinogen oxidase HemJ [Minwuia sp.]
MSDYYDVFKALHIISVISWMVGMLYLPRLFVYHVDAAVGSETSETFKVMERRLMKAIINPAMIASFLFGIIMLWIGFDLGMFTLADGWLHVKLLAVLLLGGAHGVLSKRRREFEADANTRSTRYYRLLNEVPTLLMIIIVFMVILKPF